jgi:hypothetical protein
MDKLLVTVGGVGFTGADVTLALLGLTLCVVLLVAQRSARSNAVLREEAAAAAERQRELDDKIALLIQSQAQFSGRMSAIGESFESRQTNLARLLTERIDGLNTRLGDGLNANVKTTHENLSKLHERLASLDPAAAQAILPTNGRRVVRALAHGGRGVHGGQLRRHPRGQRRRDRVAAALDAMTLRAPADARTAAAT